MTAPIASAAPTAAARRPPEPEARRHGGERLRKQQPLRQHGRADGERADQQPGLAQRASRQRGRAVEHQERDRQPGQQSKGQPAAASCRPLMSIFTIFIIACITRPAFFASLSPSSLHEDGRDDLPGDAELVDEPAALHFLPARGQLAPVVVHLGLRLAGDEQRDRLGELERRAAVQQHQLLPVQREGRRHQAALRAGAGVAVARGADDLRVLEHGRVEIRRVLGLVVERQKCRDLGHRNPPCRGGGLCRPHHWVGAGAAESTWPRDFFRRLRFLAPGLDLPYRGVMTKTKGIKGMARVGLLMAVLPLTACMATVGVETCRFHPTPPRPAADIARRSACG